MLQVTSNAEEKKRNRLSLGTARERLLSWWYCQRTQLVVKKNNKKKKKTLAGDCAESDAKDPI